MYNIESQVNRLVDTVKQTLSLKVKEETDPRMAVFNKLNHRQNDDRLCEVKMWLLAKCTANQTTETIYNLTNPQQGY